MSKHSKKEALNNEGGSIFTFPSLDYSNLMHRPSFYTVADLAFVLRWCCSLTLVWYWCSCVTNSISLITSGHMVRGLVYLWCYVVELAGYHALGGSPVFLHCLRSCHFLNVLFNFNARLLFHRWWLNGTLNSHCSMRTRICAQ